MLTALALILAALQLKLALLTNPNISQSFIDLATPIIEQSLVVGQQAYLEAQKEASTTPVTPDVVIPNIGTKIESVIIEPVITPPVVVQPPVVVVVQKPFLISSPILTFSNDGEPLKIVTSIDFSTNQDVACTFDSNGNGISFAKHCATASISQIRPLLKDCNAALDKGLYLFLAGNEYTCGINLKAYPNGSIEAFSFPFTFTVSN